MLKVSSKAQLNFLLSETPTTVCHSRRNAFRSRREVLRVLGLFSLSYFAMFVMERRQTDYFMSMMKGQKTMVVSHPIWDTSHCCNVNDGEQEYHGCQSPYLKAPTTVAMVMVERLNTMVFRDPTWDTNDGETANRLLQCLQWRKITTVISHPTWKPQRLLQR